MEDQESKAECQQPFLAFEKPKLIEGDEGRRKKVCEKLGAIVPGRITERNTCLPSERLDLKGLIKIMMWGGHGSVVRVHA